MLPHPLLPRDCQERYRARGLWTDETLLDLLLAAARAAPDRPLYVSAEADTSRTYGQVAGDALRLAAHLLRAGVKRGDAVVAPLVNGWPAAAVSAAVAGAGAVLAPLPSRANPAQAIRLAATLQAPGDRRFRQRPRPARLEGRHAGPPPSRGAQRPPPPAG